MSGQEGSAPQSLLDLEDTSVRYDTYQRAMDGAYSICMYMCWDMGSGVDSSMTYVLCVGCTVRAASLTKGNPPVVWHVLACGPGGPEASIIGILFPDPAFVRLVHADMRMRDMDMER